MPDEVLDRVAANVPSLRAVFITAMPDCLLYRSWTRGEVDWAVEDVASFFGDLIRANREGLKALGAWSSEMQATVESSDALIVLKELTEDFVCGCIFEAGAPLGMVRLHMKRMLEVIKEQLPQYEIERRPRGVRVVEFLRRYAPDPHSVLMRVALRSGLDIDLLENPETLNDEQIVKVEEATKRILGLTELNV